MGYNDFFDRENVYGVIKDTLWYYYDTDVYFLSKKTKSIDDNLESVFYCIPKLNVIFSNYVDKRKLKKFLYGSIVGNQRRFIQYILYIFISIAISFPKLFIDRYMVSTSQNTLKNIVIYPGNKRLKLLDFNKDEIINISKYGFRMEWFKSDLYFRRSAVFDFILDCKSVSDNMFIEPLLFGKPLSRIPNRDREKYINESLKYIKKLTENPTVVESNKYISTLSEFILDYLSENKLNLKYIKKTVRLISNGFTLSNFNLEIGNSHGDLQSGNIFITESNKIYILDWETIGKRMLDYDRMMLLFGNRNSNEILNKLIDFNEEDITSYNSKIPNELITCVFVLEDIKWYIEEVDQVNGKLNSIGLDNYNKYEFYSFLEKIIARINHEK